MTRQKARKRDVRSRMSKTGERYTAARRNVVKPEPLPPRAAEPPFSEAAVRKATGKGWDDWFRILDAWGAHEHTHTEIARHVNADLGVDVAPVDGSGIDLRPVVGAGIDADALLLEILRLGL